MSVGVMQHAWREPGGVGAAGMQNAHSSTPPAHIQALLLWVVVLPRGAVTGVCCGCRDFQQQWVAQHCLRSERWTPDAAELTCMAPNGCACVDRESAPNCATSQWQGEVKALAFHLCSWVLSVQGLLPNLIKLAPAAGISWYVFEETKLLLGVDPRT